MSCCSDHSKDNHMWGGLIAFIIGAVVLLQKFDIIPTETWGYLWPSILIVFGLKLMLCSNESCASTSSSESCCETGSCKGECAVIMPTAAKKTPKKK